MQTATPLKGIRVLELGAYISGPYAGSLLASLGADVVKVEAPSGDAFRRGVGTESHYFVQYNAGKRSIAVNLKDPRGVELIRSMLPQFDVFIENSRPGKTEQLGLGPELCRQINPRLIYSSASGFGDGGEWRDRAAYDSIGQSIGGFYSVMSEAGKRRASALDQRPLTAFAAPAHAAGRPGGREDGLPARGGTVVFRNVYSLSTR